VEAAKSIVTKLKLKHFVPVENPSLQSTYRMIEETLSLSSHLIESNTEKIIFYINRICFILSDTGYRNLVPFGKLFEEKTFYYFIQLTARVQQDGSAEIRLIRKVVITDKGAEVFWKNRSISHTD
jgi:hypothetical protein